MKSNVRLVFAVVMGCFFISGVAGLVYQIAWSRYLSLFLGHSGYAVVAVLVAFMGGLAIGNAAFGGVADRSKKPLALYGWLEIGIGVYAALFPWHYELCDRLYLAAARHLGGAGASLLLLKFAFSFLTILLPTTLMGATFPALTRFVTRSLSELRGRVASLYFMNSIGAVAGCVVADFWWIPTRGLEFTVFAAAAMNLIVGGLALTISRSIREGAVEATPLPLQEEVSEDEHFSPLDLKIATIAIGCSGFVAMLYEVAWTRLLALALGSSTHAYSIMLITFISGISVGAALVARWKTRGRTLEAFGWAEVALAATVLLSMFSYELLPYWFTKLSGLLARKPSGYPLYELMQGMICFGVMFIPAICLGATLPLASRIATAELARTGRAVGRIFAVNTLGTVLGAAVTGFWLMPTFGLSGAFAIGFALNAAIGLVILGRARLRHAWRPAVIIGLAGACLLVIAATRYFEPLWRGSFTQGMWRMRAATTIEAFRETGRQFRYHYYKDGPGSTVTLHSYAANTNFLSLRVNGKTDASTGDFGTQLILGHLPALMHTQATNALVIGLGSGLTASGLLRHTNFAAVDVVEISPEMADAARLFKGHNDDVFNNPRFHLYIEDAKSFLKISDQKYDIVVSEPSNPWMAGVAAVFSVEFYESCAARLADNGLMIQWIQITETSDETLQSMVKTFTTVFPFASVWRSQARDLILVGTRERRAVDLSAFLARMSDPSVGADLARGGMSEPLALLSREIISAENGAFISAPETPVHSDYYPTLDYMAQVGFFVGATATAHDHLSEVRQPRASTLLADYLRKNPLAISDFERAAQAWLGRQFIDEQLVYGLMERWSLTQTNSSIPLETIGRLNFARDPALLEEARLLPRHESLLAEARGDISTLHFYELALMRAYRAKRSIFYVPDTKHLRQVLAVLLENDPKNRGLFNLHLAELAWDRGDDEGSLRHGEIGCKTPLSSPDVSPFALDEAAPRIVLHNLIEGWLRVGNIAQAQKLSAYASRYRYLDAGPFYYPPLELVCRKANALAQASGIAK
jgi:predicted membrane-bound spermidine synthase